jgi:Uncharacterized conserved protein
MSGGFIFCLVAAVIVILIVVFFIGTFNGFVKLRNSIDEAYSTMDAYLEKRHDLIPNLVETVKGYAAHESGTLQKVTDARQTAIDSSSQQDKAAAENQLTNTLKSLFAVSENYPDLKANTNFLDLQKQLQKVEEDILNSRKYYNGYVKRYNTKLEQFPSSIVAHVNKLTRREMFAAENAADRENVKVEF